MECAFTICAALYIPYGHGRNTNWNISISSFSMLTNNDITSLKANAGGIIRDVQTLGSFLLSKH